MPIAQFRCTVRGLRVDSETPFIGESLIAKAELAILFASAGSGVFGFPAPHRDHPKS
jgi:hypothetical protein